MSLRDRLDSLRAKAHDGLTKLPGRAGDLVRKANDALGRPLADEGELADRRAFVDQTTAVVPAVKAAAVPAAARPSTEAAPVIVYHMDKQRRDVPKVTDLLDVAGIPYKIMNIEADAAAQSAIRRDSNGHRLPVVFVAGECVGGRNELVNMSANGELAKKVYG
ncbi:MAG: glutaredoxin [Proteobacteria bacterium]|nr:glutaredoxin [Pseudomonadota bacterium]